MALKSYLEKLASTFIPAPLIHVRRRIGTLRLFNMLTAIATSYLSVLLYLLRKRGLKAAWIFLCIKLFTPVGPGGAGVFWFLAGWLVRRYPQLYRFPRQLEMEITTTCVRRCVHCEHTYWSHESQPRKQMTYDEIVYVLEQFPGLRWASLVGEGSSFEHKHIARLIQYLKQRHIMCYMPDHLCDWDDDMVRTAVENDMDGIILSLDAATKETYESIKVGCNFDKAIGNLRKLVEEKRKRNSPLPEITFNYIAMKNNLHEIPDYVDLIAGIGSRKDFGAGSRIGVVRLLTFKQILGLQVEDIPEKIIADAQARAAKHDFFINFTGTNVREDLPSPSCCMAWMEPYIFMGGFISQCCAVFISNNRDFIRKHAFGNVFEKQFREIWDSKPYKTMRYTINRPDAPVPIQCAGCRVFNTLPREQKYGIVDPHTGEVMTLKKFVTEHLGENMKWRYEDVKID